MEQEKITSSELAALNDRLRHSIPNLTFPHLLVITDEVAALSEIKLALLLEKVRTFNSFTDDNNPYGENDFGAVSIEDEKFFFKFDYYYEQLKYYKPGARHVLTILHSSEW